MIFIKFIFSIILAAYFGFFVTKKLNLFPDQPTHIYLVSAFFCGLGLTSISFWLFTALTNGNNSLYYIFELILFSIIFIHNKKSRNPRIAPSFQLKKNEKKHHYLAIFILSLQLIFIIVMVHNKIYGYWDARAIWNLKARFLVEGSEKWQNMFMDELDYSHRDYPLLLPATVARSWCISGSNHHFIPMFYATIFTFFCFYLLYFNLAQLKSSVFGLLAISLLSLTKDFIFFGSWQYSDIPLALFILMGSVEIVRYYISSRVENLHGGIICSALALWTKNEGIPFFFLTIVFLLLGPIINRKKIPWKSFLKGFIYTLPVFLSMLAVSLFQNCSNDLIEDLPGHYEQIFNIKRHMIIINHLTKYLIPYSWLILFPFYWLKVGCHDKRKLIISLIPLAMFLFYFLAYIISPRDLIWHLNTSFPRIFMQILPGTIFIFMYLSKDIKEN